MNIQIKAATTTTTNLNVTFNWNGYWRVNNTITNNPDVCCQPSQNIYIYQNGTNPFAIINITYPGTGVCVNAGFTQNQSLTKYIATGQFNDPSNGLFMSAITENDTIIAVTNPCAWVLVRYGYLIYPKLIISFLFLGVIGFFGVQVMQLVRYISKNQRNIDCNEGIDSPQEW